MVFEAICRVVSSQSYCFSSSENIFFCMDEKFRTILLARGNDSPLGQRDCPLNDVTGRGKSRCPPLQVDDETLHGTEVDGPEPVDERAAP